MAKPQFVYVTYIRSTPDKVWAALTDESMTRQYWAHRNVSDWKVGSEWHHVRCDAAAATDLVGVVLESAPPHRLVVSWASPRHPEQVSRVIFAIEPHSEDSVRLTVSHGDLEPGSEMEAGITVGWPLVLSSLKSFLETGACVPLSAGRRW
jgi:uncharacterized protein YndB with AHSA1/START domain